MFDEGEHLLIVYRTWSSNCSICQAIIRFGRHLGPAWHILPRSRVFSFSHLGASIHFVTLVHRWNVGDFLFTKGLFIAFLAVFNWVFFFIQKKFHSKIIGYVDIMLTMRSTLCICFYDSSKISLHQADLILLQITSFRFKSYLQRCICFSLSPFLKNVQEVEQ